MALLRLNDISLSFGGTPLLDGIALQIEPGERIGLVGRNGSGKSTLLKLLAGRIVPDTGVVASAGRISVALLPQDFPEGVEGRVYDVVASGCQEYVALLMEYHDLTVQIGREGDSRLLGALEQIQHKIEASGAWQYYQRVKATIARTGLDEHAEFRTLSAGMKRRVFLAKALVGDPDVLLLDEPTNHLDIATIVWLEDFLLKYEKTFMFVTHDRAFLTRLATRIVEIDRGKLRSYTCDYAAYLDRRQTLLDAEEKQIRDFDKKLAKEEAWIRQGIRARRTRNEGRVRALEEMRRERERRRERAGVSRLDIQEAERSGRMVVDAESISFFRDDKSIISNFSTTIIRGDRVGIIGPNGCGKTTLLKVLFGELSLRHGKIRLGTGIKIAYFDQLRQQLDENKTLRENVADGNEMIVTDNGSRHVVGYLQDFLFSPERIMAPVRTLSGGERNRLLLAKLFVAPSNVLVLDEPTNDLDSETLELLEDRLFRYKGTILLVSHDREFLNNVVTSTVVFESAGQLQEYVGGYDDWLRQSKPIVEAPKPPTSKEPGRNKDKPPKERRKLSYKEARELEALPQTIEAMEEEKRNLMGILNSPEFYANYDAGRLRATNDSLDSLEKQLDEAYRRWDELETLAASFTAEQRK